MVHGLEALETLDRGLPVGYRAAFCDTANSARGLNLQKALAARRTQFMLPVQDPWQENPAMDVRMRTL